LKPSLQAFFFFLTFLAATLYVEETADAFHDNWRFSGWYGGGCYPNVEFDPQNSGRVYLTSDVAGIWRSDDDGDHWAFITNGLSNLVVAQIAVAPKRPSVVYAATKGGIFYSTNAGDKWVKGDDLNGRISFDRPTSYRSVSVHPDKPSSICVGTSVGDVLCSDNYGTNWRNLGTFGSAKSAVTALHYLPDQTGLLVASSKGVWRYSFASQSWFATEPSLTDVTDLIRAGDTFLAASGGEMWRLNVKSDVWQMARGSHPGSIYRLEFDQRGSRLYAVWNRGWKGGIVASTDEGRSWKDLGSSIKTDVNANPTRQWAMPGSKIASLKVSPIDSNVLIRTDWWGTFRSDNRGSAWTEKIVGAPNTVGNDLMFSPNGALFSATMDDGLLKSVDMGRTYHAVYPSNGYNPAVNGHVWRVAWLEENKLIATASPWDERVNQIILSDDGGKTFRTTRSGLPERRPTENTVWEEGYARALATDPKDKNVVYLGIDGDDGGGLFVSRNGGETWTRSEGQPASRRIFNGLAVDKIDTNVIYWGATGSLGGIYRSSDAGRTWQSVFRGSQWIFDIHAAVDGAVYAAGSQGGAVLFASRDHGMTWTRLRTFSDSGTARAITTNPTNPKMIAVSTGNWSDMAPESIYLSTDAGATWLDITGNLPQGAGAAAMTFTPDGRSLYIARSAGGIYRLEL
jgi:photosystem II stability/assembly factor-like uncharacterized protein